MDQTQVAQIIQRLAAGEQIPGWSYHPEQTTLHGDSQYAHTEPTSAFFNGQGYYADGNPMRNQTLDLGEVAKLAAIMGTAYLGGTALAGSGSAGSSLGSLGNVTQVGTPLAELGAAGVPTAEVGLPGLLAPEATAGSAFTPSMNYGPGMTGAQTSVYDAVVGATGSPGLANTAANVTGPLSSAAEWMKANPTAGRLLMSGASGLLSASGGSSGGSSGGYKDSGYRPTITRGGWQPSVTPRSMALTPTSINLPTTGQPNSGLWRYGLLGG